MLLAIDVGNTAIKFGLFEGGDLTSKFSIPTIRDATADDIKRDVGDRLPIHVDSAIVCSVVPDVEDELRSFLRGISSVEPTLVTNSFDFDLKIDYEPLDSLGTDRLVNAFAAAKKYGVPVIVCSLGTATTIDVVSADREFLGGVIAPGMDAMAEALHLKTARLPKVDATKPDRLIGNSTADAVRSGIFYGYVSMVDGLIERIRNIAGQDVAVVMTGGVAELFAAECSSFKNIEPNLTLDGLQSLAQRS